VELGMRRWVPRPLSKWPEELKKLRSLKSKKWEKAVARLFIDDLLIGEENARNSMEVQRSNSNKKN